jgi:hypothetical protein
MVSEGEIDGCHGVIVDGACEDVDIVGLIMVGEGGLGEFGRGPYFYGVVPAIVGCSCDCGDGCEGVVHYVVALDGDVVGVGCPCPVLSADDHPLLVVT